MCGLNLNANVRAEIAKGMATLRAQRVDNERGIEKAIDELKDDVENRERTRNGRGDGASRAC